MCHDGCDIKREIEVMRFSTCEVAAGLSLLLAIMISGCGGVPTTTVTARSKSPDGGFIAQAETSEANGIGVGDIGTEVDLNWTTGSQKATPILYFLDGADPRTTKKTVSLIWRDSSHLEIDYIGPRTIDFQAVKCHGVSIAVRDLSVRDAAADSHLE